VVRILSSYELQLVRCRVFCRGLGERAPGMLVRLLGYFHSFIHSFIMTANVEGELQPSPRKKRKCRLQHLHGLTTGVRQRLKFVVIRMMCKSFVMPFGTVVVFHAATIGQGPRSASTNFVWMAKRQMRRTSGRSFLHQPRCRIIEFGCGCGGLLQRLCCEGMIHAAVGCDLSNQR
jgi:hypothetical protein